MSAAGAKADIASAGYGRTDHCVALPWHMTGKTPKPTACFARRVNLALQKHIYFRKEEVMI
jgi:hypothetical protein